MSLRAAVLGHPISHSKSPALHLAAYAKLGIDIRYTAVDVTEQALAEYMRNVRNQDGWCGLSVTMPLKTAMVSEVDEIRGVAGVLGVVNTVAFEGTGNAVRSVGYNTDVAGIVNAVRNAGVASAPAAVVLGGEEPLRQPCQHSKTWGRTMPRCSSGTQDGPLRRGPPRQAWA